MTPKCRYCVTPVTLVEKVSGRPDTQCDCGNVPKRETPASPSRPLGLPPPSWQRFLPELVSSLPCAGLYQRPQIRCCARDLVQCRGCSGWGHCLASRPGTYRSRMESSLLVWLGLPISAGQADRSGSRYVVPLHGGRVTQGRLQELSKKTAGEKQASLRFHKGQPQQAKVNGLPAFGSEVINSFCSRLAPGP